MQAVDDVDKANSSGMAVEHRRREAAPKSPIDSKAAAEIKAIACHLCDQHARRLRRYARRRIHQAMRTLDRLNNEDKHDLSVATAVQDKSYQSLLTISTNNPLALPVSLSLSSSAISAASSTKKKLSADDNIDISEQLTIALPSIPNPNAYLSWIPIHGYETVELEEPYLVYLGETEQHRMQSNGLYKRMMSEYKPFYMRSSPSPYSHLEFQLSDGEVKNGSFYMIEVEKKQDYHYSQKLSSIRLRQAQRHAIFHVVEKYGTSRLVFKLLSQALQMRHEKRALYFYQVAHYRKDQLQLRRERIRKIRIQNKQLEYVLKTSTNSSPFTGSSHVQKRVQNARRASLDDDDDETTSNDYDIGDDDDNEVNLDMPTDWRDKKNLSNAIHFPNAIQHFCRTCMLFGCHVHPVVKPPREPIREPKRDERVSKVKRRQIPQCSDSCFILSLNDLTDQGRIKRKPWSPREITLLREAISMFEHDPCNLAVIIGSRSCLEVYSKLRDPEQKRWTDAIVQTARNPAIEENAVAQKKVVKTSGQKQARRRPSECIHRDKENGMGYESDMETCDSFFSTVFEDASEHNSRSLKSYSKTSRGSALSTSPHVRLNARKSSSQPSDSTVGCNGETANKPCGNNHKRNKKRTNKGPDDDKTNKCTGCDHKGKCTVANGCSCAKAQFYCTLNCRCSSGRFVMDANGGFDVIDECQQRNDYCNCTDGRCDTDDCLCRKYNIACTPGACGCDCSLLPSQISPKDRKCVNCDFIVGRHKRTYIGNSDINGLGLYAGEPFLKGDLIGCYGGNRCDAELVDIATMLGEERKRTYSFDVDDDLTIDAALIGNKMRFANHGKTPQRCNCKSEIFTHNGQAFIIIIASRAIPTGQELLFDYKLTIGGWMEEMN